MAACQPDLPAQAPLSGLTELHSDPSTPLSRCLRTFSLLHCFPASPRLPGNTSSSLKTHGSPPREGCPSWPRVPRPCALWFTYLCPELATARAWLIYVCLVPSLSWVCLRERPGDPVFALSIPKEGDAVILVKAPEGQALSLGVREEWGWERNVLFGVRTPAVSLACSLGPVTLTSLLGVYDAEA